MSKARNNILQSVRQTLGRDSIDINEEFQRLRQASKGLHNSLQPINNPVDLFIRQSGQLNAKVSEISSLHQLPDWFRDNDIQPNNLVLSTQQEIKILDWSGHSLIENYPQEICTAVVKAPLAAAETGTVLLHSEIVPSGLLFLVETLVIALEKQDIKPRYEDLWAAEQFVRHNNPVASRAVHLITGPSKTADVEQQIQVGAHGPREVYIVLLDQSI